jgi:hypothetical protein
MCEAQHMPDLAGSAECSTAIDCTSPSRPYCLIALFNRGTCVACFGPAQCPIPGSQCVDNACIPPVTSDGGASAKDAGLDAAPSESRDAGTDAARSLDAAATDGATSTDSGQGPDASLADGGLGDAASTTHDGATSDGAP